MDSQSYNETLEDLEQATGILQERLKAFGKATQRLRDQLDAGISLDNAMTPSLWAKRDLVDDAWLGFQRALHWARAEGIALVIDEKGVTITDFARKRGVSRQLISKLYNEAQSRRLSESLELRPN